MEVTHEFTPADRYLYDFGPCSYQNGWAQLDSKQDASYYGNWVNPTKRAHFSYCEGDTTLVICADDIEFAEYLRGVIKWHDENGYGPAKIDALAHPATKAEFERLNLLDVVH